MRTVKRTFNGIQFTFVRDGFNRPGDNLPHWVSANGIKLFCGSGLRGPLSAHWEIQFNGKRAGGMDPEDCMKQIGILDHTY